jgi:hypothetical protein
MALRMKTRFRTKGPKTLEQRANVVGYNLWKVAQEMYRRMSKDDFKFGGATQVAELITEALAFLVQVADRLVYGQLSEEERAKFITALGLQLAENMQDNLADLYGPGDYKTPFIRALNERFGDYSEFDFKDGSPSYGFLRFFGERVAAVLGADNKWVIEQVMEIEAPEALKAARKLVHEVLGLKVA